MTILDDRAAKAIQEAMDARVRALSANHPTTHMAEVIEVDQAGVTWVHIFGGADRTPAIRSLAQVKKGDLVTVTIEDGVVTINGSSSSPAASVEYVEAADYAIAEYAKQAMAAVLGDVLQVKEAIIGRATVEELTAVEAMVQTLTTAYANINELVAGMLTVNDANLRYATIGLENVNASNVGSAKIRELFAQSGWFDDLTVTGDGIITGKLKGVLIDGDTARFQNIYADALKLLGPDGLYHALNMAGLTDGQAQALIDQYGESLDGGLHGSHLIAESVTASQIDVTSLVAAMLLTQFVQIGATAGTHIEAQGDRFSFFSGGSGWASLSDDFLYRLVGNPSGNPSEHGWYERVDDAYTPTHDTTVYKDATGETAMASDASGASLHALTVDGKAVQDGTPTPDAPVEIRTVRGVNKISPIPYRVGDGFYNKEAGTQIEPRDSWYNVTVTCDGEEVVMTGGSWLGLVFVSERLEVGKRYALSFSSAESTGETLGRTFYTLDADYKVVRNLGNNTGNPSTGWYTVQTIAEGEAYLAIGIGNRGSSGIMTITKLKCSLISEAYEYVPYGNLAVKSVGKNKLKLPSFEEVRGAPTDNGSYHVFGLKLKPSTTYYLSTRTLNDYTSVGSGQYVLLSTNTTNDNWLAIAHSAVGNQSGTRTTNADGWLYLTVYGSNQAKYEEVVENTEVMLVEGTEPTAYERYHESTTYIPLNGNVLASLPDGTKDVLTVDSTGAATLEKRVGVAVIDGVTVKCNGKTIYGNNVRANITLPGQLNVSSSERLNCYNDRFRISAEPVNNYAQDSSAYSYELYTSFSFAMIPIAALASSDIADINAWFAANPTTVVYPLATPQTIDLGYIDMPAVPDGAEISVTAAVTPTITAEYSGRYYEYTVTSESPLPGEVAYIAVDPITRESTFYMTRSVVVKDLRFGDFKWFARKNRNMALKWIGGDI